MNRLSRWAVPGFWALALAVSYPLMVFGAALPRTWLFVAGAALSYGAEWYVNRYQPFVTRALSKVNLGINLRFFVRDALLIVLVARLRDLGDAEFVLFATGVIGLHGLRGLHSVLTYRIQRRRYPIELVNVPAPTELPSGPPDWLSRDGMRKMLYLDVLPVAGALYGAIADDYRPLAVLLSLALALGLAANAYLSAHYLRVHRISAERAFTILHKHVVALKPETILYFSGSPD